MTTRTKNALALAVFVVAASLGIYAIRRSLRSNVHAIDAVPANAFLVISLDVAGLRQSPLGVPLFGGATSKLVGEKTLTDLCGFDPLERMSELSVAVPEGGEPGDFGVVIAAAVSRDELVTCAKKVIEARQPGRSAQASLRTNGTYTLVEPDDGGGKLPGDGPRRYPTLAYRDGGPFLIARGAWLGTMIDTVERKLPSARDQAEHASLRRALGQPDDGRPALIAVATAILPSDLRAKIKAEMATSADDGGSSNAMAGVLGVASAGLAIAAGPGGADTRVNLELRCEDPAGCVEVEKLLGKKRLEWSKDISLRLFGVGPLLDNAQIENHGTTVRLSTRAPTDEAARWLERILAGRGVHHPTSSLPASPSSSARSLPADETLRARPSGDGG